MTEARFEALQTLTKEAAELLRLPENSERVVLLASLKLAHQVLTERLVSGGNVEANQLLGITETIGKMVPVSEVLPTVKIEFVEGVVGIYTCKHCGQRNELPDSEYTPPSPKRPLSQIDGEVVV
jgi:hypothetical protein